jgi:hypothetical protein
MKLDVRAFAISFGIWWGVGIFLTSWWIIAFEGPIADPTVLGLIYRGFSLTPMGSFVGLLWGIPCGAICAGIFAWLYNRTLSFFTSL